MTDRVMLDIETLGTDPGAAILSIGAVAFDLDGPTGATFHQSVDVRSCQTYGLEIDAETLVWWLGQDAAAREVLDGGDDLSAVLKALAAWWPDDAAEVWANSPAFDCQLLAEAHLAVGLEPPWAYYETRDVRTIRALPVAVEIDHEGTAHDALDDARHQAREVAATLAEVTDA